jgi:hypothetical protein
MAGQKKVKIFTIKQQSPCGPQSNCCGSIGQSEQYVRSLKDAIENLGLLVEVYDLKTMQKPQVIPQVSKLFGSFGPQATPVIAVGEEVVSVGQSGISEIISAIKAKL